MTTAVGARWHDEIHGGSCDEATRGADARQHGRHDDGHRRTRSAGRSGDHLWRGGDGRSEGPGGVPAATADPEQLGGSQLGKRYADEELGVELLCTKAGQGTLAVNGVALPLKNAKPLPASD